MSTTRFRPRKPGPEATIEDAVASQIISLFDTDNPILWTARSLPIGASMPDLLTVSCQPDIFALNRVEKPNMQILAYLRMVDGASLETIIECLQISRQITMHCLDALTEAEIVYRHSNIYFLSSVWREILPEIVAVEVKVSKWRQAIQQAARNSIFAHRSFVALPHKVARRVQESQVFKQLGVGLLSVEDDDTISVIKCSPRHQPIIWAYYYKIAFLVATNLEVEGSNSAIQRPVGKSQSRIS